MTTEQHPISLPPYPQMIMEAIEASNDANGRSKTAISKHIESTQSVLPPSHSTLLNYHLNQMKQSGQIALVKNNYVKLDPNAPPKRGRGRPPKQPKPEGDASHVAAIPAHSVSPPRRTRGPPPNKVVKDSSSEGESTSVSGRLRGRPPKKAKTVREATAQRNDGERRGRGRPPKVKPVMREAF